LQQAVLAPETVISFTVLSFYIMSHFFPFVPAATRNAVPLNLLRLNSTFSFNLSTSTSLSTAPLTFLPRLRSVQRLFTFYFLLFTSTSAFSQTTLTGAILDTAGKPLPGANVVLEALSLGDAADAAGAYRIAGVPAGTHFLKISFIGYETQRRRVVVPEGEGSLALDFRLAEGGLSMEPLIVRATRATERTPMTYSHINNATIERNNLGLDAPYLFRWTPSAVETSDAGAGVGYTGIRIRGSDATRINVTVNGIPLNDAESQSVYWVNMPDFLSSTDNVQIQRGVGASTNGAGAFGATINLQTVALTNEPFATVGLGAGSFNTFRRSVQFGSGQLGKGFSIEGRLSQITSDGYIDRASSDLRSWFLSAGWSGNRSLLKFNVFSGQERTYQAWYGVPAEYLDDPKLRRFNPAGTERPGEPYNNEVDNYRQTHYQLIQNTQLHPNWNLNLALHYTRGAGYYEQYKAGQAFANYGLSDVVTGSDTIPQTDLIRRLWLDNHFYGGVYGLTYRSNSARIEAVLGGAYSIYEGLHFGEVVWAQFAGDIPQGYRYYENDARKTDFNIYNKWNYRLSDRWDTYLDLQYRRVSYDFLGYNIELDQVDQSVALGFFNPKFGLQYRPGPQGEAYASFAVGNREPNRNDYTQSTPDDRPLPERLYNTEAGYRLAGKKGVLGANVYHMYYRNQLVINGQINQVGEYVRINVERSYRLGLELVAEVKPVEQLRLSANYTLSRNRVSAFTEYVDDYDADFNWIGQRAVERRSTALAFSPAHIANAEAEWQFWNSPDRRSHFSAALMGKYVGKQYIDNSSDEANTLRPYFFSDLRLQYNAEPSFARRIGVSLLVQNLFNARFASNAWSYRYFAGDAALLDQGFFPQAGTNVLLGLNVGF
jgi:iron complex outermembrane recepter protein